MADNRSAWLRSVLHPVLAVGLPFAFLQALDAVMRGGIVPGREAGPFGTLVLVLLAGVSQVISANVLGRERITGVLPRLRELVLTLAGCLVLVMLLTGRPFRGDLRILPDVAWPLLLCAAQWGLTLSVQHDLRSRELFLRLVEGKTGHALVSAAHDAGGEAGQAQAAFVKLRKMAVVFQVFTLLPWIIYLVVVGFLGGAGPGLFLTARVLLSVICGFLFIVILHGFEDEHTTLGAGIVQGDAGASRRFAGPLAGVLVLFLVALLLAGSRALLPASLITRFFDWISRLGSGIALAPPRAMPTMPQSGPAFTRDMELPPVTPSPILEEILRIVGIVLAAAAVGGFIFFVLRPLLRRGTFASMRRFHPLRSTMRAIRAVLRVLAGLPGRFLRWARTPGRSLGSISRAIIAGIREGGADRARTERSRQAAVRAARSRAVREFRRLSRWGERQGIGLRSAEAPMEYALRLLPSAPAKGSAIREAARVFELLVFSPAPGPGDERALSRIVNGIVR